MGKYLRNKDNAIGDVTTAASEVKLVVNRWQLREDEFGRSDRLLRVELVGNGATPEQCQKAALTALRIFAGLGWDAMLCVCATEYPWLVVRIDAIS